MQTSSKIGEKRDLNAVDHNPGVLHRGKTAVVAPPSAASGTWLGGRDSNPDSTVQSRVSYH